MANDEQKPAPKSKPRAIPREERSSELLTPADVLQSLFKNGKHPLSDHFLRWKIWAQWEDVVGASLSKNCAPVGYHQGTLDLWVKSASWMQEMRFLLEDIRGRVNTYVGREFVTAIRLTLDKHAVPTDPTSGAEAQIYRNFVEKTSGGKKR